MKGKLTLLFLFLLIIISGDSSWAHTINYALESKPEGHVFGYYTGVGFTHILPYGYDHLLFILGIFLLNSQLKPMLMQATFFTLAHSVTLIMTANDSLVSVPEIVEPLIAITILFIAIENIYIKEVSRFRYLLVFVFGLIHGMGFAGALSEIGLPRDSFYTALIGFNFGVELGQITFILAVYFTLGLLRNYSWYRSKVAIPLSVAIGLIAIWWSIERIGWV